MLPNMPVKRIFDDSKQRLHRDGVVLIDMNTHALIGLTFRSLLHSFNLIPEQIVGF